MEDIVLRIFQESTRASDNFINDNIAKVVQVIDVFTQALKNGRKILLFGNGGSAADAQHLAAEFINRFMIERPPLPALALSTDTSVLTSIANDYDFSEIFAKQIRALGHEGDIAWGLSTSGKSPNVVKAVETAKKLGMATITCTGGDGGLLSKISDHNLNVAATSTPRIQEVHILIGHAICELIDFRLFKRPG
ncbi:MAG: D-sedoheptulose 7-phosphate isomerase [Deltaproteobacteria bacterium]|nr:D-sedoheptulose 7-phosphate isomerase [Deltaproteobacteria bacterium]